MGLEAEAFGDAAKKPLVLAAKASLLHNAQAKARET